MSNINDVTLHDLEKFHGHLCPGLVLGYRMAKAAMKALSCNRSADEELTAIVENDACGVDALQLVTGCTMGKGNLFFKDYGKMAFTLLNRKTGKAVRVIPSKKQNIKRNKSKFNPKDRNKLMQWVMNAPEKDVLIIKKIKVKPQSYAKIRNSVECFNCGELVMESRIRIHNKNFVCIPCLELLEK